MTQTHHRKVTDILLNRIVSGYWAVGARLPTEVNLAAELGVSRATLRIGLTDLERMGLVARRKRAGTTVISSEPRHLLQQVTGGVEDLLDIARHSVLDITSVEDVATGAEPLLHGLHSETGYWLEIIGTRRMEDSRTPFNWTRVFVTGRYAGIRPMLGPCPHAVYRVIEDTFDTRVARLAQMVRACVCPNPAAPLLGLSLHAPVLNIRARLYDAADGLIEVSDAYYDPAKFSVSTDVRLS